MKHITFVGTINGIILGILLHPIISDPVCSNGCFQDFIFFTLILIASIAWIFFSFSTPSMLVPNIVFSKLVLIVSLIYIFTEPISWLFLSFPVLSVLSLIGLAFDWREDRGD